MANLTAQDFISRLERDPAFRSQTGITSADISLADFQAKAAAAGFGFTQEEIMAATEANKTGILSDEDLDQVAGGLVFTFKLVAVKTISWAHD